MDRPSTQTTTGPAEPVDPAPNSAAAEPSIWDTLSGEDRAALDSALARSRAGLFATDEEVEAAFALFGP